MRIGMFTDMYLPAITGITNFVQTYKRAYEQAGHEVFVFTFGNTSYRDPEPNVIRSFGIPAGDTGFNFSLLYSPGARELIGTMDVAHVHHPFQTGRLAAHYCRQHDIPIVFTTHTRYDLYSDEYLGFLPVRPRHALVRRELKRFLDMCDAVTVHTPAIGEWLAEFAEFDRAIEVPAGIDLDRYARPSVTVSRDELGIGADEFVFVHVGRIEHEKNVGHMVEEYLAFHGERSSTRLLVVGGGSALHELQELVSGSANPECVVFVGPQSMGRVPSYLAIADAFVTASVTETLGLVAVEAMAAGLPVVGIDSPGIGETVVHGVSGLLAPSAERGVLAQQMTRIAGDPELRARLAAGSHERAAYYSVTTAAERMLALFTRLANDRLTGARPPESD